MSEVARRASSAALRPDDHKAPRTARGRRTRQEILEAGLRVFDRDGFLNARIQDISAEAGVALGSIYSYFDDKADILAALLDEVFPDLFSGSRQQLTPANRAEVFYQAVHSFLSTYQAHRPLMRALEQATLVDERFAEYWYEVRGRVLTGLRAAFAEAQRSGGLSLDEEPTLLASTVGGAMLELATVWYGDRGERSNGKPFRKPPSLEEATRLLTRMFLRALYLEDLPRDFVPPAVN